MFVFACISSYAFQANDSKYFSSLFLSMIACFSTLTRRWSTYFYVQFYGCDEAYTATNKQHFSCHADPQPFLAVCFFLSFLLIVTFMLGNVVIGIVINQYSYATTLVKSEDWLLKESD